VRRFDVLFIPVAIDMGLHSVAGISAARDEQVRKIRSAISENMAQAVRNRLELLAQGVAGLPNQLYVQSVALTKLIDAVLRYGTLYYAQRLPKSLGNFVWRLDAKDVTVTAYEKLWREIVGPFLQTESLRRPLLQLEGADYSAFARYEGVAAEPPAHLRPHVPSRNESFAYVDIQSFLGNLAFCRSDRSTGVQAVDLLASAVCRACNGHLQVRGWKGLGRLMPTPPRGDNSVHFIALEDVAEAEVPYADVVHALNRETKSIIVGAQSARRPNSGLQQTPPSRSLGRRS
jgi:hypothetical protein